MLNIVLVQPQIPQNTGNIARTCAATGAKLHIVEPMGFTIDDKKLKRAGLDYWHMLSVRLYPDIEDFFYKNPAPQCEYFYFSTKGQKTYSSVSFPDNSYLIYGREDAGLPEELIFANLERCLRIPMLEGARSLNLSNSVALTCYEVLRQWGFEGMKK